VPRASVAQLLTLLGLKGVCRPCASAPPSLPTGPMPAACHPQEKGEGPRGTVVAGAQGREGRPQQNPRPCWGGEGRKGRARAVRARADSDVVYYGVLFTVPWCGFCRRADLVLQEVHRAFLFFSELYRGTARAQGTPGEPATSATPAASAAEKGRASRKQGKRAWGRGGVPLGLRRME